MLTGSLSTLAQYPCLSFFSVEIRARHYIRSKLKGGEGAKKRERGRYYSVDHYSPRFTLAPLFSLCLSCLAVVCRSSRA